MTWRLKQENRVKVNGELGGFCSTACEKGSKIKNIRDLDLHFNSQVSEGFEKRGLSLKNLANVVGNSH